MTVIDFGQTDDGVFYLVMELINGRTLDQVIETERSFRPERVVTSAEQLAVVDVSQGMPQRTFQVAGIRALIANETHVFVLQDGGTEVLVWPVLAPADAEPRRIRTGGLPRAMALDSEALYVAELAGRIVRIPILPDLGEPEEVAVELPKLSAITVSSDRIYLIADDRLVAWLPKS